MRTHGRMPFRASSSSCPPNRSHPPSHALIFAIPTPLNVHGLHAPSSQGWYDMTIVHSHSTREHAGCCTLSARHFARRAPAHLSSPSPPCLSGDVRVCPPLLITMTSRRARTTLRCIENVTGEGLTTCVFHTCSPLQPGVAGTQSSCPFLGSLHPSDPNPAHGRSLTPIDYEAVPIDHISRYLGQQGSVSTGIYANSMPSDRTLENVCAIGIFSRPIVV
jgi:hypothetical protein